MCPTLRTDRFKRSDPIAYRTIPYFHPKGSYTEAGTSGCNGAKGSSEGYEEQDAALFFDEWRSEYLMVDSCGVKPRKPPHGPSSSQTVAAQARWELTRWKNLSDGAPRPVLLDVGAAFGGEIVAAGLLGFDVVAFEPNVDEHGNVVVTYRQAPGKEKKKKDGDESDDDDGCDLRVLKCRGAFTPSTRLVSISRCRGWFLFRF